MVNRSGARARDLVRQTATGSFEIRAAPLERVAGELVDADVVLTAVAAESHVLDAADFDGVTGPLLVIDLGVPRNVDPAVAGLDGVTLLDMDTLSVSVARALGDRAEESVAARRIVAAEVDRYRSASRRARRRPDHRVAARPARDLAHRRARAAPGPAGRPERGGVGPRGRATRAALAKMLHEPTMLLKETAGTPRGERLVEALRILFDL